MTNLNSSNTVSRLIALIFVSAVGYSCSVNSPQIGSSAPKPMDSAKAEALVHAWDTWGASLDPNDTHPIVVPRLEAQKAFRIPLVKGPGKFISCEAWIEKGAPSSVRQIYAMNGKIYRIAQWPLTDTETEKPTDKNKEYRGRVLDFDHLSSRVLGYQSVDWDDPIFNEVELASRDLTEEQLVSVAKKIIDNTKSADSIKPSKEPSPRK